MKVIIISDLHGSLIPIEEEFDLLLMCGDGEPVENQNRQYHKQWLHTDFADWVNSLPYKNEFSKVVMIAGNHSFYLEGLSKTQRREWLSHIKDDRLVYLDNELYEHLDMETGKTIKIFGCPYCKPLAGWPFTRENLERYYDFIPEGLDILLTHEAPDILNGGVSTLGRKAGTNFGNKLLAEYSQRLKPKYHFFGHIHSSPLKTPTEYGGVIYANASVLCEDYRVTYKPLILNID